MEKLKINELSDDEFCEELPMSYNILVNKIIGIFANIEKEIERTKKHKTKLSPQIISYLNRQKPLVESCLKYTNKIILFQNLLNHTSRSLIRRHWNKLSNQAVCHVYTAWLTITSSM